MASRRNGILPLLAALILVLAACGPAEESPDGGATDGGATDGGVSTPAGSPDETDGGTGGMDASGDLFAFGFGYETGDVIAQTRVDYAREQYPDLNVTFSESGFDDQQFLTALASGDAPDVVNLPRNRIGTYIARGVLQPLEDCFSQAGVDPSIYRESAMAQVTVDGSVYAIPEFYNTRIWIANNSVFEAASLDPNEIDWSSWDAIAEANEQLLQADGDVSVIGIDPKVPEFLPLWVQAAGGRVMSEDGMESLLDTPEVAEALTFAKELIDAHGGATPFLDFRGTWDFFGAENQVAADQIGAWPMEQWYLNVLSEVSPDDEITVLPFQTTSGDPITFQDGNSWAIVADTDNPDGACAFISAMTSTDAWVASAEARAEQREADGLPNTGVYTANSEADEIIFNDIVDLSEFPALDEAVQTVLEVQDSAFGLPPSPASSEFVTAMNDAVNRALTGDVSIEDALAQADQEAQDAIDGAAR
jgi:multiple sugar transport system substrate-binding protein